MWSATGSHSHHSPLITHHSPLTPRMLPDVLILSHAVATFIVMGTIWFVQLAYYPNLAAVGREAFVAYQREHIRRITAVAWTMLTIELVTGAALAFVRPPSVPAALTIVNAALILSIWWSTWFVQVPLHRVLEQGWDEGAHRRLVGTNWFRTVVYTVRGLLVVYLLWTAMADQ